MVRVFELDRHGCLREDAKTLEDFKLLKRRTNLPIRDMRIFFQVSGMILTLTFFPSKYIDYSVEE